MMLFDSQAKAGSSFDPAITDWAARVVANGGPTPSVHTQTVLSNFVTGAKADGFWNDIIIFNAIAADSLNSLQHSSSQRPEPRSMGIHQYDFRCQRCRFWRS